VDARAGGASLCALYSREARAERARVSLGDSGSCGGYNAILAGQVAAFQIHSVPAPGGSAPWYAVDLQFETGITGRIDVLPTAGMAEETYDLFAVGSRVRDLPVRFAAGLALLPRRPSCVGELAAADMTEDVLNGCYDEATEFIRALRGMGRPHPSIEEVFPSVELCWKMARNISVASSS